MNRSRLLPGYWQRLALAAVLCWMALALFPVAPARAAGVTVSSFYATTKQAYDAWPKTNYKPPLHVTSFPSGTASIAFYVSYAGASKTSGYYIVLRHHHGATVDVIGWFKLSTGHSSNMSYLNAAATSFPDGPYDADLVVDDKLAATVAISVGGAGGPGASGVTISAFVVTSAANEHAWLKRPGLYPLPPTVTIFPAGTTSVAFVYIYKGATPKVTTDEVTVAGPNGLKLTDNGPYKLGYTSGGEGDHVYGPRNGPLPSGSYAATLLINGSPSGEVAFVVG